MKHLIERKNAIKHFNQTNDIHAKSEAVVDVYLSGGDVEDIMGLIEGKESYNSINTVEDAYTYAATLLNITESNMNRLQVEGNENLLVQLDESEYTKIPRLVSGLGVAGNVLSVPTEQSPNYIVSFNIPHRASMIESNLGYLEKNDYVLAALEDNQLELPDGLVESITEAVSRGELDQRIAAEHSVAAKVVSVIRSAYTESLFHRKESILACPMCKGDSPLIEGTQHSHSCQSCGHSFVKSNGVPKEESIHTACPACSHGELSVNESACLECNNCATNFIVESGEFVNVSSMLEGLYEEMDDEEEEYENPDDDYEEMGCPGCGGHVVGVGDSSKCTACGKAFTGASAGAEGSAAEESDMEFDISDEELEAGDVDLDGMGDDMDEYDPDDDGQDDELLGDEEDDEDELDADQMEHLESLLPSERVLPHVIITPFNESVACPVCGNTSPGHACCGVKFWEAEEDMLIKPKGQDDDNDIESYDDEDAEEMDSFDDELMDALDMEDEDDDDIDLDDTEEMTSASSVGNGPAVKIPVMNEEDDDLEIGDEDNLDDEDEELEFDPQYPNDEPADGINYADHSAKVNDQPGAYVDTDELEMDGMGSEGDLDQIDDEELEMDDPHDMGAIDDEEELESGRRVELRAPAPEDFESYEMDDQEDDEDDLDDEDDEF